MTARERVVATVLVGAAITVAAQAAPAPGGHSGDLDCADFADQISAQRHLDDHPGDPDGLDGDDGDGRACESNPCPCDSGSATSPGPTSQPVRRRGRVVAVTDGDTLQVRLRSGARRSVRLIGIDTPESRKPGVAVECGAKAAASHMRRLAFERRGGRRTGVRLRLSTDPTQGRRDGFGRLLAYADRRRDGRDLGRAMVRAGWASTHVHDRPFQRLASYSRAQKSAAAADRGVFGSCGGDFHSEQ